MSHFSLDGQFVLRAGHFSQFLYIMKPHILRSTFLLFTGIWDVLSNQEVVDFVRTRIAQRMEPEQVCRQTQISTDILLMMSLHFQANR